jgi:calcium-binding protein CML
MLCMSLSSFCFDYKYLVYFSLFRLLVSSRVLFLPNNVGVNNNNPKNKKKKNMDVSDSKVAAFQHAFHMFDKKSDGAICGEELEQMFTALGESVTADEVKDMIAEVDVSGTGTIELNEFMFMMAKRQQTDDAKNDPRAAFDVFDANKDGFIDEQELSDGMERLGEKLTLQECREIIATADKDKDGKLSFAEFLSMSDNQYFHVM